MRRTARRIVPGLVIVRSNPLQDKGEDSADAADGNLQAQSGKGAGSNSVPPPADATASLDAPVEETAPSPSLAPSARRSITV
jgi:hypothetical protein